MFQIQYLVASLVAALVLRHAPAAVTDRDMRRPHYRPHSLSGRHRRRIPVGLHLHPALPIHDQRIDDFFQRESFLSWTKQRPTFLPARLEYRYAPSRDGALALG